MISLRIRLELHAAPLDQLGHSCARLRAALDPRRQTFCLEFDSRGLLPRIINSELFEATPIPGVASISDNDAIEGAFLAPVTR
jgi:hypothetical protein